MFHSADDVSAEHFHATISQIKKPRGEDVISTLFFTAAGEGHSADLCGGFHFNCHGLRPAVREVSGGLYYFNAFCLKLRFVF